ncbi:MAG TPA: tetratricopeptide repeat protein, partial [Burkholderiaceae bacterium]|nr:tetratricopeptide repeat protein [Burkholderiaceae bacterium]
MSATTNFSDSAAQSRHLLAAPPEVSCRRSWGPHHELESTLQALDAALVAEPGSADLLFLRASSLQMLGREAESRIAYVQALQRDPDHLGALCNLGRSLLANRNHAAAHLVLERAVCKHPGDLASHVALGIALYQMRQPAKALATLERAVQIAPYSAPAHAAMAFVLEALGRCERAKIHRRKGFHNRSLIGLPYRGEHAPVRVLLLASTNGANAPLVRFLDDRTFQTWVVVPEFHDPKTALPPHELVVNAIGDADAAPAALSSAHALLARVLAPVVNLP